MTEKREIKWLSIMLRIALLLAIVCGVCAVFLVKHVDDQAKTQVESFSKNGEVALLSEAIEQVLPDYVEITVMGLTFVRDITYATAGGRTIQKRVPLIKYDDLVQIDPETLKLHSIRVMAGIRRGRVLIASIPVTLDTYNDYETHMILRHPEEAGGGYEVDLSFWKESSTVRDVTVKLLKGGEAEQKAKQINDFVESFWRIHGQLNRYDSPYGYQSCFVEMMEEIREEAHVDAKDFSLYANNGYLPTSSTLFEELVPTYNPNTKSITYGYDVSTAFRIGDFTITYDWSGIEETLNPYQVEFVPVLYQAGVDTQALHFILKSEEGKPGAVVKTVQMPNECMPISVDPNQPGFYLNVDISVAVNLMNPSSHDDVAALICDDDTAGLSEQEMQALKNGIARIPLSLWESIVMNPQFDVKLVFSEKQAGVLADQIEAEPTARERLYQELIDEEKHGFYLPEHRMIVLDLWHINDSYAPEERDFRKYTYTFGQLIGSNGTLVKAVFQLENLRLERIEEVLLHEIGHYIDYNSHLRDALHPVRCYSNLLFEGWQEEAIQVFSNDYYHTQKEFFAESFTAFLLYPDALKKESEITYNWMKDCLDNYQSAYDKPLLLMEQTGVLAQ